MKLFYADAFELPLPEGHRFPIQKYQLLRLRITASGLAAADELCIPPAASDSELQRAHMPEYVQHVIQGRLTLKEIRRIGFPWSLELVERSRRSVGGTLAACRNALLEGYAANLAGGTHHAYPDHGEGFCVFNDVAVAARAMQAEGRADRVVVIDCDVHQGNGTAAIFAHDPTVFTFSIHGAKNFPFHKEAGDLDIALADDCEDQAFLEALQDGLRQAIDRSRASLAIYVAGADPFYDDRLGRLSLTKAGLAARDRLVMDFCEEAGLPVAIVMGGGYARQIEDTVDIHFTTIRLAIERSTHGYF